VFTYDAADGFRAHSAAVHSKSIFSSPPFAVNIRSQLKGKIRAARMKHQALSQSRSRLCRAQRNSGLSQFSIESHQSSLRDNVLVRLCHIFGTQSGVQCKLEAFLTQQPAHAALIFACDAGPFTTSLQEYNVRTINSACMEWNPALSVPRTELQALVMSSAAEESVRASVKISEILTAIGSHSAQYAGFRLTCC
jgi:hypothetical protein